MSDENVVYLKDIATGKLVEATLVDNLQIREIELTEEKHWKPFINKCIERLRSEGVPKEKWPQHSAWSWRAKYRKLSKIIAYKFFGIRRDDQLQGLMLLSTLLQKARAKAHEGKPILYVQYIESAPWNLSDFVESPRYSLVGTNFISVAIEVSKEEESKGRIALHSLPQSDGFYVKCGMTDLGRDLKEENLRYFEMTQEQAEAFISEEEP